MRRTLLSVITLLSLCCAAVSAQTVVTENLLRKFIDLPAPGFQGKETKTVGEKERPKEFFDEESVPPDDAPIEDLLAYWERYSGGPFSTTYQPKPSAKTLERILEHCQEHPDTTGRYVNIFPPKPEIADAVKKIYDELVKTQATDLYRVSAWLKFNSTIYEDDLVREANNIKDENNYVQNPNQYVLRALARVDWDAALPIIIRLENDPTNPYSQILAKWVSYQHAIDTGDFATESAYRHDLQKIVENAQAPWAQRDLAMDSLTVSNDWEGRDDWYMSLLEDETLLTIQDNGYTGLTTLISNTPRKKWLEKMIELTKSTNFSVRSAAARNLMNMYQEGNTEIAKALLPWLTNPGWAKESGRSERSALIKTYGETDVPEAVPALIAILMNEEDNRDTAAQALGKYKDPRAIPALKSVLAAQETNEGRAIYIGALMGCGGFTDDEQMAALETYVRMISTEEGKAKVDAFENNYDEEEYEDDGGEESGEGEEAAAGEAKTIPVVAMSRNTNGDEPEVKPIPLEVSIGSFIAAQEEPAEGLVVKALARLKILKKTNPPIAALLAEIMEKWKGRAIYIETLRRIRSGEAEIDDILNALANRSDMREKIPAELSMMRGGSGTARALGACIANDNDEYLSILGGTEADAQVALLGCTRLLRAPLPVEEVGELLGSSNKLLSLAAQRYLETEDGVEARKLVLGKNKDQAMILGARLSFVPDVKDIYESGALDSLFQSVSGETFVLGSTMAFRKKEADLRKEMSENPEMLAIFGLLPDGDSGGKVIRVYKDKIVYTYYEDAARFWEKTLTRDEYDAVYDFIVKKDVDALKPILTCGGGCSANEFVMFGRDGGRRVYYLSGEPAPPFDELNAMFDGFQRSEDARLRYRLADSVPGVEVLWAGPNFQAQTVWAKGSDLRVLIKDTEKEAEIEKSAREAFSSGVRPDVEGETPGAMQSRLRAVQRRWLAMKWGAHTWRKLETGKVDALSMEPPEIPFLRDAASETPGIRSLPAGWQVRSGNGEIRVGEYDEAGLFRVSPGQEPVKIKDGSYETPIVTGDGRWVVVSKTLESDEEMPINNLVRINLQTGREYKINLPPSDSTFPIAFVASHNRILVYQSGKVISRDEVRSDAPVEGGEARNVRTAGQYYLLDAATGLFQRVRGEFGPIEQQMSRPLQATGSPGEFWAALPDAKTLGTSIGRYNEKTFTFTPMLTLPNIKLDSMSMWVDETAGKIYFVYLGHVLSVPMKRVGSREIEPKLKDGSF